MRSVSLRRFTGMMAAAMLSLGMAAPAVSAAPAAPDEARVFVDQVGGKALHTLQDSSLNDGQKRAQLNALFAQAVDIPYVAKFVLGRYWRTATPQQQQDYLAAYEPFLIKNYVSRVARYSGQTYKLTESKPTEDGAVVGMILQTPDGTTPDVTVNYRLVKTPAGFKVIDIVVEGVSLLNTQRSEFASVVARNDLDYLIDRLRKMATASR